MSALFKTNEGDAGEQIYVSRLCVLTSLVVNLAIPELSVCVFQFSLEFVVSDAQVLVLDTEILVLAAKFFAFDTEILVLAAQFLVLFYSMLELLHCSGSDGSCDACLSAFLDGCGLQTTCEQIDASHHGWIAKGCLGELDGWWVVELQGARQIEKEIIFIGRPASNSESGRFAL